jgi:uncharacterized protein (DUF2336 family)
MSVDLAILRDVQEAVETGSSERRSEILQRVTDLFIFGSGGYSDQEISLFDDVLLRLTVDIEVSTRALLAVRLAPIPNAPPRTIRDLAFDEAIVVAGPVLRQSQRLDEQILIENARQMGQDHLLAISQRATVSETLTDLLLQRGARPVAFALARNPGAQLTENGFAILVSRSQGDDRLAVAVGERSEIPAHLFEKLLEQASDAVRKKLEGVYPEFKREVRQAVAEVTSRVRAERLDIRYGAARELVEPLAQSGELDDARLVKFAKERRLEETTVALSLMCELPLEAIEQVMAEERSEKMLILARTIGLSWPTLKAVLLLRAGKAGFSRHELEECRVAFERLKVGTANQITQFYRARPAPRRKPRAN